MKYITQEIIKNHKLQYLKRIAARVYLYQLLTFALAGLPCFLGVVVSANKNDNIKGTWLESHFNWQIQTTWIVLAGFALAAVTFSKAIGMIILITTLLWMIYRIVIGWYALIHQKPIDGNRA